MFRPNKKDFIKSPYTGLTRECWIEAAEYLLLGIFQHIKNSDEPVIVPREETEITYPHKGAAGAQRKIEEMAEIFEGLTRSFLIAAPLLHNNPELEICGICIRDYYKNQILRSCTPEDPVYVGNYEDLQKLTDYKDPYRCYQQTVETCSLVIGLWACKEVIWDCYTKEEKDVIAALLTSYAHQNTAPHNWRMFTMLDLAFLHMEGYPIDTEIMLDHARMIIEYYAGDGWYRDGQTFDYYSAWAFNVYAPLWNLWYGYDHEPYIAKKFEQYSNKLMETYADFFDRDGYTNMWARSNIYRFASISAFAANLHLKRNTISPGLARRISSGTLMQFLERDDFLSNGIPTMGFYGTFSPLVQGYSCAESVFWLGKAFLVLLLPENHPFWSDREENGSWEQMEDATVKETVLNGPALCFTNHNKNGETILRTGKVYAVKNAIRGMWAYAKLSYNTKYPWEALPSETVKTVGSQQYVIRDLVTDEINYGNATLWGGEKEHVLYRRQIFGYETTGKPYLKQMINLADFPVSCGIMRVDKHRLYRRPAEITLGSYGFPDNGTEIIRKSLDGAKCIMLKGKDHCGNKKQMAMTIYDGWKELEYIESRGTNPDSEKSIILYATGDFQKQYGGKEPYIMISQVLTKECWEDFTEDELFPISSVKYEDTFQSGCYGSVQIILKNGTIRTVNFEEMEGRL